MDMIKKWEKALRKTEILRSRIHPLSTIDTTVLPYIFLAESSVNPGDSVVRKGEVYVEKPSLILPDNIPQFEGFDFDQDFKDSENTFINFLLVRGVRFPSFKYNNKTGSLDLYEGRLKSAAGHFSDKLQKTENVNTGLIIGPEDCWQFSVIIFICSTVVRSADKDIKRLLDDINRN